MATYPWTMEKQWELHRIDIEQFPNVKRWNAQVSQREGVRRGVALLADDMKVGNPTEETYDNMFGGKQYNRQRT